jgi:hypothetical protein
VKISEDLIAQRDYLALPTTKWVQGTPNEGEACMAYRKYRLQSVGVFTGLDTEAYNFLNDYMHHQNIITSVIGWNDTKATCKEEVLEWLDKAIIAAEEIGD